MKKISQDTYYIGVDDLSIDLFESQYRVPDGISYNSYLIRDTKTSVLDTVDARKGEEWKAELEAAFSGNEAPDYLVIHHLEPDHSGLISWAMERFPQMQLVAGAKAIQMLPQFCGNSFAGRTRAMKEGEVLELGVHSLQFFSAAMVHWPEVMVSYDAAEKALYSADAFGRFGALSSCGFYASGYGDWQGEAGRYYFNIVGKYGGPVTTLLNKVKNLEINSIRALHGPIIDENPGKYTELYAKWAACVPERDCVLIACASIHGGTMAAARELEAMIKAAGVDAKLVDLCRSDFSENLAEAFRCSKLVLAACSYDGGLFTPMYNYLHLLQAKSLSNRRIGIIENGSWAPVAGRVMKEMAGELKGTEIVEPMVTIRSRMKDSDRTTLQELANAMLA